MTIKVKFVAYGRWKMEKMGFMGGSLCDLITHLLHKIWMLIASGNFEYEDDMFVTLLKKMK